MKKICIIGLGWLGEQMAYFLSNKGYELCGTTTASAKAEQLAEHFATVIPFKIEEREENAPLSFESVDYFLITIPPSALSTQYASKMQNLLRELNIQNPSAVFIYTSSTSVYGSREEHVHEKSDCRPLSQSAQQIHELEKGLLNTFKGRSIVIRLAGLCGKNRHPIHSLSLRQNIAKPNAGVNLVHSEDVVRFIEFLMHNEFKEGVFNLCSTDHPSKKEYYQWAAKQLQLQLPTFDEQDSSIDKTIICNSIRTLDFQLKYTSPYQYPELN